jgi:hypothetical protein
VAQYFYLFCGCANFPEKDNKVSDKNMTFQTLKHHLKIYYHETNPSEQKSMSFATRKPATTEYWCWGLAMTYQ